MFENVKHLNTHSFIGQHGINNNNNNNLLLLLLLSCYQVQWFCLLCGNLVFLISVGMTVWDKYSIFHIILYSIS